MLLSVAESDDDNDDANDDCNDDVLAACGAWFSCKDGCVDDWSDGASGGRDILLDLPSNYNRYKSKTL